MELTMKEIELVYLGASIAAGCKPCTYYHFGKALETGASEEEISSTITTAVNIREAAKNEMMKHASNLLEQSLGNETNDENLNLDRLNIMVSIGAAFALNCTSTLSKYIALIDSVGITSKELSKIFKAANLVKMKAASCVDKISMRFEKADVNERSISNKVGCGCEKSENDVQIKSNDSEVNIKNSCY